jgi:hypothetical protein
MTVLSRHELDAAPWCRINWNIMETAESLRRVYGTLMFEIELTLSEASLPVDIEDSEPMTQVRLAERLGSGRAVIGSRIDALERRGQQNPNPIRSIDVSALCTSPRQVPVSSPGSSTLPSSSARNSARTSVDGSASNWQRC